MIGLIFQSPVLVAGGYEILPPKYEFRAVWIASVNNIDWPGNRFSSPEQQKMEFRAILDKLKVNGINAVVVQVRAAADAFYQSPYEPWSQWLTGKQGQAPSPFYDPLQFMVEEAHKRNMEFHAWINPYRAVSNVNSADIHPSHITKTKPHWFLDFGTLRIFNPGIPEVRDYIVKIVSDIVYRYDIDGIHFDDYFYPYPSATDKLQDNATFYKYRYGFKHKADWRRYNVNMLIKGVHNAIQQIKPRVKFGVSPYGVWRNNSLSAFGSATTSGLTSYDNLYADVRLWMQEGWVDYVAPQLYQNTKHRKNSYTALVRWWSQNNFGKHVFIGHATYRLFNDASNTWYDYGEMPKQMRYLRNYAPVLGSVFYSCKSILRNTGSFSDTLRRDFYKYPALIPPMTWKDSVPPLAPQNLRVSDNIGVVKLEWDAPTRAKDGDLPNQYIIYRFLQGESLNIQNPKHIVGIQSSQRKLFIDWDVQNASAYTYIVTSLDRLSNESLLPYEKPVKAEVIEKIKEPEFDALQPISKNYPFNYEEAAYFYQLMLKSSKEYLQVTE